MIFNHPWWYWGVAYFVFGYLWGLVIRWNKPELHHSTLGLIALTWPIGFIGSVLLALAKVLIFLGLLVTSLLGLSITKLLPGKPKETPKW